MYNFLVVNEAHNNKIGLSTISMMHFIIEISLDQKTFVYTKNRATGNTEGLFNILELDEHISNILKLGNQLPH